MGTFTATNIDSHSATKSGHRRKTNKKNPKKTQSNTEN